jgi:hypothetical protein
MVSISQDEDLGGLSGLATSVLISRSELNIKSDFRYRMESSIRLGALNSFRFHITIDLGHGVSCMSSYRHMVSI